MATKLQLSDFLNKHEGEDAWLFGKGPTLDLFDISKAGSIRCAVNDVVKAVPNCTYTFSNDCTEAWNNVYPNTVTLFRPDTREDEPFNRGPLPDCNVCTFKDYGVQDSRLTWTREKLAEDGLCIRRGTIGSAIQIFYIMGIKRVFCVGIDGGNNHSKIGWSTRLRGDHWRDYNAIRQQFVEAAKVLGIEVYFFSRSGEFNRGGYMKVRMLDDAYGEGGEFVKAGTEHECSEYVGRELIYCGKAKLVSKVQKPVERAIAQPKAETAEAAPIEVPKKRVYRKKK